MLQITSRSARAALLSSAASFAALSGVAVAGEPLFVERNQASRNDMGLAAADSRRAERVRINRRALNAPEIEIDLFGEVITATRTRTEQRQGELIWVGRAGGSDTDDVILTWHAGAVSGLVQYQGDMYRIGAFAGAGPNQGREAIFQLDLAALPADDALDPLPGGGEPNASGDTVVQSAADLIQQDLLVAYTQGACDYFGGCANAQSAIATAVADINTAYLESGVNIAMNLVGTKLTDYAGLGASAALTDLRLNGDGVMDDVHAERDAVGADIVALIYNGDGCGIGYLGASQGFAFSVTKASCLVGNRTMAHEIGHNQGLTHDRTTVGGGTAGAYNYGFRRCSDGSIDDLGSPYFRTIMSYSCASAARVGRISNPQIAYNGVPQGIDPAVNPSRAAFGARTLNESAAYIAGFRSGSPTPPPTPATPPAAPSALTATAGSPNSVSLAWNDNASDETGYRVQSSRDGQSWSTIAQLGDGAESFVDTGLNPDTTYYYRVFALNSVGSSGYSNTASARTAPLPAIIEDVASGDIVGAGVVSGTYAATHFDDGVAQQIVESGSGGPKRSRRQAFSHQWTFDVFGGVGGVMLEANAWVSGAEGAHWEFSTDGGASWAALFLVTENDPTTLKTAMLPAGVSGPVRVRVRDAESASGEAVDSISIDYIRVVSATTIGAPPSTPENLDIVGVEPGAVALQFTDSAQNEFGFAVRRATSAPANCLAGVEIDAVAANPGVGLVDFTDTNAAPSGTYWYLVAAYNAAGDNGACAISPAVSTPAAPALSASGSGYKVRGLQTVDVQWSPAAAAVEIYRNGALVASQAGGAFTDAISSKGGGAYTYEVCAAGAAKSVCADAFTINF